MCFTKTSESILLIAEKNIHVKKELNSYFNKKYIVSPYMNTKYFKKLSLKRNFEISTKFLLSELQPECDVITEGIHSYHKDIGRGFFDAIIPKGTRYFTNGHEYVSEKLIVKRPLFKYMFK